MHPRPSQKFFSQSRMASTSTHRPFPFPAHSRPTPHQIFHLPPGASQKEIKQRYYDLVRVHHPDSPMCRSLPAEIRHTRFQSITKAYDILRGKGSHHANSHDSVRAELERRRRAQDLYRHRTAHAEFAQGAHFDDNPWHADADDRWKDWLIISAGVMCIAAGIGPMVLWPSAGLGDRKHLAAAKALAEARNEAQIHGEERRREIRHRVEENRRLQAESQNAGGSLDNS